jgi:MmyB-like transcription regulator ligand binding domain
MVSDPLRRKLGGFLRATREHTAPADVGLSGRAAAYAGAAPRGGGGAVRREHRLVHLARAGRVAVSRQVLDSVCRVLRIDAGARRHALELAGFHGEAAPPADRDQLRLLIDAWPGTPALILDERLYVAGWNAAYRDLVLDLSPVVPERRNLLLLLVGELQDAVPEWPRLVRLLYGRFRTTADRLPADPRMREVRRLLAAERPDLAHWWRFRSVSDFAPVGVRVRGVAMTLSMLSPVASADATVLAHTPTP